MAGAIKAVVFDIGNVLIGWDPFRFYDGAIGRDRRERLFAEVDLEGMNLSVDLGADFVPAVEALAEAHPDWRDEVLLWRDHWLDMASPEIPQSGRALRALRARGVPVYALSNFGNATLDIADRAYPVLTEFDRRFISGALGVMKPDPAIYEVLEQGTGLSGDALLFTDDRPENIAVAEARGWRTHLFQNPQGWVDRLVQEGLLDDGEAAP